MEAPLEIRYAGVVIGRAQEVRNAEGDALFIPVRDPMPVGTVLRMRSGEQETPVRVVRAVESADATVCGMQVRTIGEAEEVARDFIPPPAIAAEKLKPATPTPVVEVDMAKMRAESAPAAAAIPDSPPAPVASAVPAPETAPEVQAAEAPAPEVQAAATAPAEPASAPVEVAAVPDAVPVAVGSSMTGALRNATESIPIREPAKEAPTVPGAQTSDPASPQAALTSAASLTQEYGSVVESASQSTEVSAAVSGGQTAGEDLPPARPIAGPSGRRKTKRRK